MNFFHKILERPLLFLVAALASQFILAGGLMRLSWYASERAAIADAGASAPSAIVMRGQTVYYQEGCQYCHTQNIRPFAWELQRFSDKESLGYFIASSAAEYQFETPFLRGSRRIGPDLAYAATKYSAAELETLLKSGRNDNRKLKNVTHKYAYLFTAADAADGRSLSWAIRILLQADVPFSDPTQRSVFMDADLSRGDALIAYLLSRGQKQKQFRGKYYRNE